MKLRAIFILLLLSIGVIFCIGHLSGSRNTEMHVLCQENLDESYDEVLSLMRIHQGKYINQDAEELRSFSALLGNELEYVDLRDPNEISFSFSSFHPETSKRLIYCLNNRIQLGANTFLEEDEDELRLENLGTTQNGYIWCIRIRDCWFYWESYLPT